MEQIDPLSGLTAKLDEMQREVRRLYAEVEVKPGLPEKVEPKDLSFVNSLLYRFLGNR